MSSVHMKVGYVVLYVTDVAACVSFWVDTVGMVERKRIAAGPFNIVRVGFADQEFALELVPLEMMKANPDGLDLATPSIAFQVDDLDATRERLVAAGVQASEISTARGPRAFAFADPEGRWFAVLS
jgi:lactoylglutathione lyase